MDKKPIQDPDSLVARSPAMIRILELARRASQTEATVLITGESGTGKERLARYIHDHSTRASGPFVAINCGALPETLLASELFGHVKGAFTGANRDRPGLFAAASGGTLFLDEIAETSPGLQVSLLRALQERVVRPIGAVHDRSVNARVLAATNRDLGSMVSAQRFRADLYYRLRVIALELPPLRERTEAILPLARQFIGHTCHANNCGPCALSSQALDALQSYAWPGNVRELHNAIERAVILAEGKPRIELDDLPPEIRGDPSSPSSSAPGPQAADILPLAEVERRHILKTLERLGGDRKAAARALGIGQNTLWRRLKSYGLVRARREPSVDSPRGPDYKGAQEGSAVVAGPRQPTSGGCGDDPRSGLEKDDDL